MEMKNKQCNLGLVYHKKSWKYLYPEENTGNINEKINKVNNTLCQSVRMDKYDNKLIDLGKQSFQLKTTYPGLLIGTGYLHQGNNDNEFKVGFYFDYTWGIPVIPGSSIKGVLRSYFPDTKTKSQSANEASQQLLNYFLFKYPKEVRGKKGLSGDGFSIDELVLLRQYIFEGEDGEGNLLPLEQRDIFFDALIQTEGQQTKLLYQDYITPHYPNGVLKEPIPIKMLKIGPNIKIKYMFDLKKCKIGMHTITEEDKKQLFKALLLFGGIGAKTNVGYGQFIE